MVLKHDMSSEYALQMYEVWLKYLKHLSSYRADTICDGQTHGEKQYISRPFQGGDITSTKQTERIKYLAYNFS